ncbi:TetR/AcrR family transcriptional regulator [Streptomyces luteolifulvus]|jgi:AcrR family transcriptional regulator|uniref:TetR/AcrR family transcriptional regulator n=1 Tax=Streptomyces luteolifulvus TaxID=2615112 RepID=A0A6H9UYZ8_9ACTN|nr:MULTISPECIES: TetR/AcrR family transcriptional regulator [Streptomyces]KAB1145355.1 TetR/AcrR family transcriptional regulator [Streptomyces luteolifulvus]MXM64189.1 TetR family transcriptional regulator [Streptomyces sp. HUCO-GS316]
MARVSQAHLDARRRQILDAAALCFARNGFHATSMQDVLKEAGLSAGAVYRYFSGKEELIAAIVAEVLGQVRAAFEEAAQQSPPPPPDLLVASVLGRTLAARESLKVDGEPAFPRLVIQVWTETLRNSELAAVLRDGYGAVRQAWARVAEAYQEAGMMRADVPPDDVARTMIAAVLGFLAQQSLFGPTPVDVLRNGLRALMSMPDAPTHL